MASVGFPPPQTGPNSCARLPTPALESARWAHERSVVGCHSGGAAWRCWRRTPTQPHRPARSCRPAKELQLRRRRGHAHRGLAVALERMSPGQPLAARATARASSQQRRRGTPAPPLSSPRCGAPSRHPTGDPANPPTLAKASPRTATRVPQRSGLAPRPASAHARRAAAAASALARGGVVRVPPRSVMLGFGRATSRWRSAAGR